MKTRAKAVLAWIASAIIWKALNEEAWKQTGQLTRTYWRKVKAVHRLQRDLRWMRELLEGLGYRPVISANAYEEPHVSLWERGLSLFSDLQPVFDRLTKAGLTVDHTDDCAESGIRWWAVRNADGRKVLEITASLAHDAECKAIDTGEVKPVLKFVCPGDPEYPMEAIA